MKEIHLPFNPTRQLRAELVENYLVPAIDWLSDVDNQVSATVLLARLGNLWETAYVILRLLRSKRLIEDSVGFKGDYVKRISDSIAFLLDHVRESQYTANWDGGLYDTAIVIRALMEYIQSFPTDVHVERASVTLDKGLTGYFARNAGMGK